MEETKAPETYDIFLMSDIYLPDVTESIQDIITCLNENVPMRIYLSTAGGDPSTGMFISDLISNSKVPITLVLCGEVASAGFLIAVSGHNNPNVKTVAYPSTCAMWHSGDVDISSYTMHLAMDWFEYQQQFQTRMLRYIANNTELTVDQLEEWKRAETWMFAEDLLELGIVDEIL